MPNYAIHFIDGFFRFFAQSEKVEIDQLKKCRLGRAHELEFNSAGKFPGEKITRSTKCVWFDAV